MQDVHAIALEEPRECFPPNLFEGATLALNVSYVDVGSIRSIFDDGVESEFSIGDVLKAFKKGAIAISNGRLWILLCKNPLVAGSYHQFDDYQVERCIDLSHITGCRSIETLLEISIHDGLRGETLYLTDLELRGVGMQGVVVDACPHSIARMIENSIPALT